MSASRDPSSFYRLNEELAVELARLDREGAFERLKALLAGAEAELWISSARPPAGLEELLGILRPGAAPADAPARRALAPEAVPDPEAEPGCGCGPDDAPASLATGLRGGWDHEGVLATRSRFTVVYPDGAAGEVYMPDHICPSCLNEADNHLDACTRRCVACGFAW